mgnify:CR=1 FL=1
MKKWVCPVCGYVHEGDVPPAECPVCHVPGEKFTLQAEEKSWAAEHVVGVGKVFGDNVPEETLGHVFGAVRKVAQIKGLKNGYRLMVNTGEDASQSVQHFHVHMLGGGWMPRPNDQDWGPNATNVAHLKEQQGE